MGNIIQAHGSSVKEEESVGDKGSDIQALDLSFRAERSQVLDSTVSSVVSINFLKLPKKQIQSMKLQTFDVL